jgi:hypothetical protein
MTMAIMGPVNRRDVLRWRFHRQQFDRPAASLRSVTDVDLLDAGVQGTGPDGSAWATAIRGAPTGGLRRDGRWPSTLVLARTLRGAPHAYRTRDLAQVATAAAPLYKAGLVLQPRTSPRCWPGSRVCGRPGTGTSPARPTPAST